MDRSSSIRSGILAGTGQVGATTVSGVIAPGSGPGTIGTLTINGNYVQNGGSTYAVVVNSTGQSSLIKVNGSATLNGGTVVLTSAPGAFVPNSVYTILTSTGPRTGTYSAAVGQAAGFLSPVLIYDPNDVKLVLQSNFSGAALTFNQHALAKYIDTYAFNPGGDLGFVVASLRSLDAPNLRNALDQLGGSQYQSLMTLGRLRSLYEHELLTEQIRAGAVGGIDPLDAFFNKSTSRGQEGDDDDATQSDRKWSRYYGLGGKVFTDGNAAGFGYDFYGFQLGYETALSQTTRLGLIAGYNHSQATFEGGMGKADADGMLAGLYASQSFGNAYVLGASTYGFNSFIMDRPIEFGAINREAIGQPHQSEFNSLVEAGYNLSIGKFLLRPYLSAHYLYLGQTNFLETGANSIDINMRNQDTEALWTKVGFRAGRPFVFGNDCSFTPVFHATYVHDMIGEDRLITGNLAGAGGSFSVEGAPMSRNFLMTGISFAFDYGSVRLIADYTLQTGGSRQTSSTGSGGLEVRW